MPEDPNEKLYQDTAIDAPKQVAPSEYAYAELDVTTNFSFLRGASHPDEMVFTSALLGHCAMAVTDVNTVAGVVRAFEAARRVKDFHLIIGTRLAFNDGTPDLLVWAPNRAAYGRMCRILTIGRQRAPKGECHLTVDDFLAHQEGLLAALAPAEPGEDLKPTLRRLRDALDDRFSLAVNCNYIEDNQTRLARFAALSRATHVPLVATNHVHYHDPGRRALQDVLTCVREKCTVHDAGYRLFPNAERCLKPPEQMHALFRDHPQAIRRGLEIARRCTFSLEELKYEYPDEVVPAGKSMDDHLRELTYAGAGEHYPNGIPDKIRALLEKELAFICGTKYAPYFLTVHDLVRFARSQNILCQGRGSAANSAVCYCLGVTSVDPDKFQLVFERFASESRKEPPDIDIDFEHERREEVIQYVYNKYGRDRAAMTAVVISYRGRSAVRDVGKAMGISPDVLDQLAGKLDWWHRGSLNHSQLREAGADPLDPTIRRLIALTTELLGFPRHLSQHVGGLVISRHPIYESVPIENCAMDDRTVIQWDKDDIDVVGMFKVDCLALGMLTAISKGLAFVNSGNPHGPPLQLHTIPDSDPAVYDMASDADTVGVFQIESRAQMSMLPRLRPREFYDLVIEVAIVRPGPIQGDMVHPYLKRRNSEQPVEYPNEELKEVLKKTLGIPLFQEQAMRVVMIAAKFSAIEADDLRRAMAAWRRNGHINTLKARILRGMSENGYTPEFAESLFKQIQGFGSYGFPESHAASFAKLVYASAWIKRYHPAAFCAALLNSQPMGFYQPAQLVRDAKEHGVEVRAVDVNESEWDCGLEKEGRHEGTEARRHEGGKATWGLDGPAVRLGFRQVKGMSEVQAKQIVEARARHGRFMSVSAFHQLTRLPASVMRRLAEADAFGSMGLTRRQAVWQALELHDNRVPLLETPDPKSEISNLLFLPPMPLGQEVLTDYVTHGLSLKAHPISLIRKELNRRNIITAAELQDAERSPHGRWVKVAGLVLIRQRPGTASGVVFETIEDETGTANLILWSNIYERYRPAARHAGLLLAEGYVQREGQVVHVLAKRLLDLSHLISGYQLQSRDFH